LKVVLVALTLPFVGAVAPLHVTGVPQFTPEYPGAHVHV
jgi:hypothetical protein